MRAEMGRDGIARVANAESSSASLEDQLRLSADLHVTQSAWFPDFVCCIPHPQREEAEGREYCPDGCSVWQKAKEVRSYFRNGGEDHLND